MYQSHWDLDEKPFEAGADPRFYFPGQSHQAALLKLRYAVESRRGAALLAGPCGAGKTLLIAMLRQVLSADYTPFVHLVFPQLSPAELLSYLTMELTGSQTPCPSLPATLASLQKFLGENADENRHTVLVVDEAQLLDDPQILETLRLLLNFESAAQPALTLLFCGQTGLLPLLERVPQLDERLGVKCLLRALSAQETGEYAQHRLQVAGAKRPILESTAVPALYQLTQGIPRRINRLMDLALLIGYAEGLRTISAAHLDSVQQELVSVSVD